MAVSSSGQSSLVHSLATLLRNDGMLQCDDTQTFTPVELNSRLRTTLLSSVSGTCTVQVWCELQAGLILPGFIPTVSFLIPFPSPSGDLVLDGSSTLTLQASSLQQLIRLFEQYLLPRSQQHGFLALPSHPADTDSLLQLQFLFDILQKTISLKVTWVIAVSDVSSMARKCFCCAGANTSLYLRRCVCVLLSKCSSSTHQRWGFSLWWKSSHLNLWSVWRYSLSPSLFVASLLLLPVYHKMLSCQFASSPALCLSLTS